MIIKNRQITEPIINIVRRIKTDTFYFSDIKELNSGWIMVTCPFHKEGREKRPSCGICSVKQDNWNIGDFHCFTCGEAGTVVDLVAFCYNIDNEEAEDWLVQNYGKELVQYVPDLPEIIIGNRIKSDPEEIQFKSESELNNYNYLHPYLLGRGISAEVLSKYKVGYDPKTDSVTFPLWDINDNLVAVNRRSVTGKRFDLESQKFKCVYLLNYAIKEKQRTVYVVESQVNALTLATWGYPAIALLGTGSHFQYDILKHCGIKNFILCFDGDNAGRKGQKRFIENMPKDIICSYKIMPEGKDVNDLTKEEFDSLEIY